MNLLQLQTAATNQTELARDVHSDLNPSLSSTHLFDNLFDKLWVLIYAAAILPYDSSQL